ncbi:heavy metal sensor kinase [Williamsia limnetica]|uniref:histidine kinase n=1 Tax=Williamsia limnetica TaxID=882452 RepID=A0A318RVI7_WILLI|nr:ATP-binding protein [Williamsia limnetica]PYE20643.1 heavy metal sensor kinase [Williamsia limnetica]
MRDKKRPRLRSVRARITLIATAVVALALVVGGLAFVMILSATLRDSAESAASSEVSRFEAIVEQAGSTTQAATALADLDGYAQLVSAGEVVGATEDLDDAAPLATRDLDDPAAVTVAESDGDEGERLVIVTKELDDGTVLVAGVDDETRADAVDATRTLLFFAVPVVVVFVGLTCWIVVGRALRPVERLRREAEQVTAADLSRRVGIPGSGDEIDRLASTLNGMLGRLETSQVRQQRFVSDASHELRSPISSLRQNAEVALSYPGQIPPDEFAATVKAESERMGGLVDGLLLLARADEATLHLALREVDLDDVALREVSRVRADAGELIIDGSKIEAARINGDEAMLGRAVRNLVDNAVRHARGRVAVSTHVVGGHEPVAVVVVEDDGAGVPEDQRERIFERFVRMDESRARDAGGAGLGLAIVAEIVAAHEGSVHVVDSLLGGARFEIRLPR